MYIRDIFTYCTYHFLIIIFLGIAALPQFIRISSRIYNAYFRCRMFHIKFLHPNLTPPLFSARRKLWGLMLKIRISLEFVLGSPSKRSKGQTPPSLFWNSVIFFPHRCGIFIWNSDIFTLTIRKISLSWVYFPNIYISGTSFVLI